jgi:hypothetical protein
MARLASSTAALIRQFRVQNPDSVSMTLIVAAANPHFVVQVSDRRLSWPSGEIVTTEEGEEKEEGKTILWVLPSERFLVGYAGLAQIGQQSMAEVLSEIILRVAPAHNFDAYHAVPAIPVA